VGNLESAVERLVEAQRKTEEQVKELAAAQRKTEERVRELSEAQYKISASVDELTKSIDRLHKQVGGLSDAFGGEIEDIAYIVLHDVLQREFGWQVGLLERSWQKWDDEPEEVNVFGRATDPTSPGKTIWIVGEAKHNLTAKEVTRFIDQVERARRNLSGEVFPVCFCYRVRPEVQEMVKEAGIRLVFSYGRLD
jgi:hypothetical protein